MPDLSSAAAPAGFLTALAGTLAYLGNTIVSDRKATADRLAELRAQVKEAEEARKTAEDELETELRTRRAIERDLNTAELEIERLQAKLEMAREMRR